MSGHTPWRQVREKRAAPVDQHGDAAAEKCSASKSGACLQIVEGFSPCEDGECDRAMQAPKPGELSPGGDSGAGQ